MENVMLRPSPSKRRRPTKPRLKMFRSSNPLNCPDNMSLYEWESRMAEEKLAAERKSGTQPKAALAFWWISISCRARRVGHALLWRINVDDVVVHDPLSRRLEPKRRVFFRTDACGGP